MQVAIIGGGAAGFFSAIQVKENYPDAVVSLFEKSSKLLSKVRISGGGRCNVTTGKSSPKELLLAYPRGGKELRKCFGEFGPKETIAWYEQRGVALKTESDGRVFPETNDSATIISCLTSEARKRNISIRTSSQVNGLKSKDQKIIVEVKDQYHIFDKVILASGGSPKESGLTYLKNLGHNIESPVPSLFTFNLINPIKDLQGVSIENVKVKISGTRYSNSGPLLITHWGFSGPCILKLSSLAARDLNQKKYAFDISVNWVNATEKDVRDSLLLTFQKSPKRKLINSRFMNLPTRLWHKLIEKCMLEDRLCGQIGKKGIDKLISVITNDNYKIKGKTTFKDEFVTCGGVSLKSIDMKSMQSKCIPNLYFAGEVLDIDGITGGYNLQAAWTTGYIAGQLRKINVS